jgi:hypothetical protein
LSCNSKKIVSPISKLALEMNKWLILLSHSLELRYKCLKSESKDGKKEEFHLKASNIGEVTSWRSSVSRGRKGKGISGRFDRKCLGVAAGAWVR